MAEPGQKLWPCECGCGAHVLTPDKRGRERRFKKGHNARLNPPTRKGSAHHRWNASQKRSSHGYVKVRVGVGHPLADPNGYAYEHLVVWVSAGNPQPNTAEVLHHRNEDRADNRLENLELCNRGRHIIEHHAGRGADGRFVGKKRAGRLLDGRTWDEFPPEPGR